MTGKFKLVTLLGLVAAFVAPSETANILCVFTSNSPSHIIIHMSYARALVENGHNVTVVTTLPLKDKNPRFHHIYIPSTEARLQEIDDMKSLMSSSSSVIQKVRGSYKAIMSFAMIQYDAIQDQSFQEFMHNPGNKFDLLIMGYFLSDYQFGLGLHFKCPIVISWMGLTNPVVDRFVGNPPEIAYVPASPIVGAQDPHAFKGRLVNFLISIVMKIFRVIADRKMLGLYNDLFPSSKYPSFEEAGKKVSLLLCNSHFTEGVVRPNVPAVVDVGGIQVKEMPDPLPKDLEEILKASSEHGVIYVSFGTNIASGNLYQELFENIFKGLAGLNQTVLWKWDDLKKPGIASNIHYRKWLPQDDLLSHPNMRLFITHAGKGGVSESQFHGVPMVALPLFADQPGNAAQLVNQGFGVSLNYKTLTADDLKAGVLDVLENPVYSENIKRFSKLYRDRPMTARQTAVYWMEYVIRHKGAYHMQSPLVHMNTWQYISADVLGFLLFISFLVYKTVKAIVVIVLRKVRGRKATVKVKAN